MVRRQFAYISRSHRYYDKNDFECLLDIDHGIARINA
jgi:hypothetical protein